MNQAAQYSMKSTREVAAFLDSVSPQFVNGADGKSVLDSVKNDAGVTVPPQLNELLGQLTEKDAGRMLDSVQEGIKHYMTEHGCMPTADVVEAAIQQGSVAFRGVDRNGQILDSANSNHHDQMSLQPNRAVVAILSAIAEAIPFAGYLPVDIGSNQAKLAIMTHQAGTAYGDYAVGGIMDGVSVGDVYASSQRMVRFDHSGAVPYNSKFSVGNLAADPGYCDPALTGVPVLRGRTSIFVNGLYVCSDLSSGSAANSPFSGTITVGANTHVITGYVTVATGAIQITTVPVDFAVGTEVVAQSYVDYEASPSLIPNVIVKAETFDIYANSWRVKTGVSIDAQTQMKNELGLDANSEGLMAIRTQMAMERHYLALRQAYNLSWNNQVTYDYDWTNQKQQKTRAQIIQDLAPHLANADQKMANDTMDHGITHLYAPAWFCALLATLPTDLFKPSGVTVRPGVFRVGRLFDKYEVYYSPKVVSQNAGLTTSTLLAIGRSTQVARNPIILGDAVAPTFLPLGMQQDLNTNSAMYGRDFTVPNPHVPSALGCARISVSNLQ